MLVQAYFNLHKKCWSIRDKKTRRVIKHLSEFSLFDCTFKVSEAGRQRVLREKRKNVHAFIEGRLSEGKSQPGGRSLTYNPYKQSTFTCEGEPVSGAFCVMFFPDKRATCLEPYHVQQICHHP